MQHDAADTVDRDGSIWDDGTLGSKILFFYFSFTNVRMQTYSGFLRSLIDQMMGDRDLDENISRDFQRNYPREPTESALQELLTRMIFKARRCFLVIDALDECLNRSKHGRPPQRELILKFVETLASGWNSKPPFITKSRHETDIQVTMSLLGACEIIFKAAETNSDIRRFVETPVEGDSKLSVLDQRLKEEIKSTVSRKAGGV